MHFRRRVLVIGWIALCLVVSIAGAAEHYVRAAATGSNDGTDWLNAWTQLPPSLNRGDTYLIADGVYQTYRFDDLESGALLITIKKATGAQHGTGTGWDESYGDGQAEFPSLVISTGYWFIDGLVGSGGDPGSYGFRIAPPTSVGLTRSELVSFGQNQIADVTVKHCAIVNVGPTLDIAQYNVYGNSRWGPSTNVTISHNYISNGCTNVLLNNYDNCIIEYNYFDGNWSSPSNHGQQVNPGADCDDGIIRGNLFRNSLAFVVGAHTDNLDRWRIYNNTIVGGEVTSAFGNADSSTANVVLDWEVHHNTFVGVRMGGRGAVFAGILTDPANGSTAYNNLFYECVNPSYDGVVDHTNSAFYLCSGLFDGVETGTAYVGDSDPFVDSEGQNFHLVAGTVHGRVLEPPYDLDAEQLPRGLDGLWDRGAFEFLPGLAPVAPSGLRIRY